jgi:heat shock protein HslJ
MKVLHRFGLLVALMLLFAACDTTYGPEYRADGNPIKLREKWWQWVGYTSVKGGYFTDVPNNNYFRVIEDTIEGVSGCNGFIGSCSVDRVFIKSEYIVTTLLGCPGEKEFSCLLNGPVQYHQRDSMLILVPAEGEIVHLVFKMR